MEQNRRMFNASAVGFSSPIRPSITFLHLDWGWFGDDRRPAKTKLPVMRDIGKGKMTGRMMGGYVREGDIDGSRERLFGSSGFLFSFSSFLVYGKEHMKGKVLRTFRSRSPRLAGLLSVGSSKLRLKPLLRA